MTATIKLITEQTANQLVDAVNRSQADGWFPVCGVVVFNARYTQLMVRQSITRPQSRRCLPVARSVFPGSLHSSLRR